MAENLLRSVSEADAAQQDESAVTPHQPQGSGDVSQQSPERTKRPQVSAACQPCRQRKIKCDALRPCSQCVKRTVNCHYETLERETHLQASKRKYDEMARSHETFAELFQLLAGRSERDSVEILRRIRSGYSPEAVLRFIKTSDVKSMMPDPRRLALEAFLISLAHSTGTLRDIFRLATRTLDPVANVQLPTPEAFLALRNRIVRLPYVEAVLRGSQRSQQLNSSSPTLQLNGGPESSDGDAGCDSSAPTDSHDNDGYVNGDDDPLHRVPATPWTTITESDEAVSHLVSLFLAWINPTWRFVEPDLFLLDMRSQRLNSDFCSSFLVNSICAIACLHSEHDVAFVRRDKIRITRGEHFHDEALRLWALEENRPTLTNMQALCIISLESNYRAKDRLGLSLVPIAARLNNEVPLRGDEKRCTIQGISQRDFARARLSTHWTVICTHIIMRIAFMSGAPTEYRVNDLPKIHDVFDDKVDFWIGYPLTRSAIAHRPTLYLRERCKLAELFQEIHDLTLASDKQHNVRIRDFANAVDELSAKLQRWYQRLPFELHYGWPMSIAVWELHASYLAFLMTLRLVARTRFQPNSESQNDHPLLTEPEDEDPLLRSRKAREMLSNAIPLAHRSAQILRDFRERYGLKITPAWLLQLQAVTAGVLVLDPELVDPITVASPMSQDAVGTIQDSHTAFDEVFRSLLGTGVEVMIARGIARMMYHTALEQKVTLSRSTRSMLQIMSDTAWRPSDLSLVNSAFPNFATTKGHEDHERMTELLSKWERLEI